MNIEEIHIRIGQYLRPVKMLRAKNRLFFKFGFNKKIMAEIKAMKSPKYHGFEGASHVELLREVFNTTKIWSVADCPRNWFQLEYLTGGNPYKKWDNIDTDIKCPAELRDHQRDFYIHGVNVHYGIWAGEMGVGKTLPAIRLMDQSGFKNWWYVAPKSALASVREELVKWDCKIRPRMFTYEALTKEMKNDPVIPQGVIFDESQKIKTPTSQRSEAAAKLADAIRYHYGDSGYVILMTGTPAPKSPIDWWNQCEIACPGFIREGSQSSFKLRLGVFDEMESAAGFKFNSHVAWLDDPNKCLKCGEYKATHMNKDHPWERSENEIDKLYERLKGLVVVKFKKDCLDLPEKQYRVIRVDPTPETLRAAQLITSSSSRIITALTNLRELSDGFQYKEVENGTTKCDSCNGTGEVDDFELKPQYQNDLGVPDMEDDDYSLSEEEYHKKFFNVVRVNCSTCDGSGKAPKYKRVAESVDTPKDDVLIQLLDEHRDVGRFVVYAGFEASVERCVRIALEQKWAVIKWDGKGIKAYDSEGNSLKVGGDSGINVLKMFQEMKHAFPQVVFVGNSDAAGTGLTLTASPSIFYYSNTFKADARIQSEDRIHRLGMDENRGATIIDVIHLPTDEYVLNNLKEKRDLQNRTMGDLSKLLDNKLIEV